MYLSTNKEIYPMIIERLPYDSTVVTYLGYKNEKKDKLPCYCGEITSLIMPDRDGLDVFLHASEIQSTKFKIGDSVDVQIKNVIHYWETNEDGNPVYDPKVICTIKDNNEEYKADELTAILLKQYKNKNADSIAEYNISMDNLKKHIMQSYIETIDPVRYFLDILRNNINKIDKNNAGNYSITKKNNIVNISIYLKSIDGQTLDLPNSIHHNFTFANIVSEAEQVLYISTLLSVTDIVNGLWRNTDRLREVEVCR